MPIRLLLVLSSVVVERHPAYVLAPIYAVIKVDNYTEAGLGKGTVGQYY